MASRWTTALVEPPTAARVTIAFRNAPPVMTSLGRRPALDHLDDQAAAQLGLLLEAAVRGRDPGRARDGHPERLGHEAHRGRRAHRVAVAGAPDHRGLRGDERRSDPASRHGPPRSVARPTSRTQGLAPEAAVSIGPPGTTRAGRSTEAAAISSDGIVLSQPPSSTTPSIGLARNSLLGGHRGEVPPEHRGRPDLRLAEAHDRHVERHAAGLPDPVRDAPGDVAEVAVARHQVRAGIGDGDVRPAIERVVGQAASHPAAMDVAVPIRAGIPVLAATSLMPRPSIREGRLPILGGHAGR